MLFWASVAFFFPSQVPYKTKNPELELMFCVNGLHRAMYQNIQRSFLSPLLDFLFWGFFSYSQFFHLILSLSFPKRDIFPCQVDKSADTTGLSLKTHIFHTERIWDGLKSRIGGNHFSWTGWSRSRFSHVTPKLKLISGNKPYKHVLSEGKTHHTISIWDYVKLWILHRMRSSKMQDSPILV